MVYNQKYRVYVNKDGVILKYIKKYDRLCECTWLMENGYIGCGNTTAQRVVWETFNGEIPDGYEVDHIDNSNRADNRLCNLQLLTHSENIRKTYKQGRKPVNHTNKVWSEFGRKFKEHFGLTRNTAYKLYKHEQHIYYRDGKCSWE